MNRRGFLKLFAGASAAAIVGAKVSYFFAPAKGWNACPPFCREHMHKWQLEKAFEDIKRQSVLPQRPHIHLVSPAEYDQIVRGEHVLSSVFKQQVRKGDIVASRLDPWAGLTYYPIDPTDSSSVTYAGISRT